MVHLIYSISTNPHLRKKSSNSLCYDYTTGNQFILKALNCEGANFQTNL